MASDQELRDCFKLKWVPVGVDEVQIAKYSNFLEASAERSIILRTVFPDEFELLVELEDSAAILTEPVERNPGSTTHEKMDWYPERCKWGDD